MSMKFLRRAAVAGVLVLAASTWSTAAGAFAEESPATTQSPALTEAPSTDAPEAEAPASDAPATEAPETDAPATAASCSAENVLPSPSKLPAVVCDRAVMPTLL